MFNVIFSKCLLSISFCIKMHIFIEHTVKTHENKNGFVIFMSIHCEFQTVIVKKSSSSVCLSRIHFFCAIFGANEGPEVRKVGIWLGST